MHVRRIPFAPVAFLGFLILSLLAFGASVFHPFAPIDDWFLIVENMAAWGISWENLKAVFTTYDPELYIPLTFVSWQFNYMMSGLDPWTYHLTNILLHAGNALLVTLLLIQFKIDRRFALAAGALFAVHPLNTEAVVWVAGRKDLLSTLFYLLSLLFYVRFLKGTRWMYAASLVVFVLALLSKAMAVTLPALLILIDILIERRKITARLILEKIPYALLSVLFIIIATGGKERVIGSTTLVETILMAGRSTMFYIEKFFLPLNLTVFYTHRGVIMITDPKFALPWAIILVITVGLITWSVITLKKQKTISPLLASILFGGLFFFLTLAPTFLNFQKGAETFVAVDRYAYLPMTGLLFAVAFVLQRLKGGKILGVAALIMIIVGISLSGHQTNTWMKPEYLYQQALNVHPHSLGARISLVKLLRDQGQLQEAFDVLKAGLPYGDEMHLHLAAGMIYARTGQVQEAIAEFDKAKQMDPTNPESYFALGSLWEQTGNPLLAEQEYAKAVKLDHTYVLARVRLARYLKARGALAEAENHLREAIKWNPNSIEAL